MNDTTHEQLSALVDGELPRDELRFLLRRLDGDAGLAQRFSRHQVAGAALRREWFSLQSADAFAAGVMARLDGEAVVVRRGMGGRILRWAGGGAIAASVAVVALMATRPAGDDSAASAAVSGSAAVVAAAPAASVASLGDLRAAQSASQADFTGYAQPASFVPNYTPRYAADQVGKASEGFFIPYVLVVGSRQAPAAENAAAAQPGATPGQ